MNDADIFIKIYIRLRPANVTNIEYKNKRITGAFWIETRLRARPQLKT